MASWSFGETLLVAHVVGAALESMGSQWYVGGSVASSVHGIPRATQDADIVATLRPGQGKRLAQLLGDGFYIDADTAEEAIRGRRSFNVIHLDTMFKVDIFVFKGDAYGRRRRPNKIEASNVDAAAAGGAAPLDASQPQPRSRSTHSWGAKKSSSSVLWGSDPWSHEISSTSSRPSSCAVMVASRWPVRRDGGSQSYVSSAVPASTSQG